jgi:hypothetical protein
MDGNMKIKRILIQIYLLFLPFEMFVANAQPVITQQTTNQVAVGSNSAAFYVSVSGTGPFTYQWQFNGNNLPTIGITTVAGNGTNSFSGDGGAANNAALNSPFGVSVDASGNVFIADSGNNRIRKVATNGIITTVVDYNAVNPYYLSNPQGVAVDVNGNVFIADTDNALIRKLDTNNNVANVAGNRNWGFSGDEGYATNAWLNKPVAIAVDSGGNMFIADNWNNRIRKVATNGIITTIAGVTGVGFSGDGGVATNASLYNPFGVAVDGRSNIFIADSGNNRIRKIATNGIITTVAGNGVGGYSGDGGPATNAWLSMPRGLAVDAGGNLFIADSGNNVIRMLTTNGIITTIAGGWGTGYYGDGGAATSASLYGPYSVAVDASGNLFIADSGNIRIRMVCGKSYYQTLVNPAGLLIYTAAKTNAGSYSVIITSPSGSVTSSVAILTVIPANITQQPQNQTVALGSNTTFAVVTTTSAAPLAYQWYFSNSNLQSTAGATAQMLSGFVYGAILTNGGSGYTTVPQMRLIGGGGSGASGTATVSNGMVTAITMTNAGSGYTSIPTVVIDPPNGLLIGQTNATINLTAITTNNVGNYYVVIFNNTYGSITSSMATLTLATPSITQQPQNQTVASGATANFNVAAAGSPPFCYQWWMVSGQQSNATAVPLVINGFVLAATMTSGGAGYLTIPLVQFVGGSGSGANGTAVVSNRMVTAINMGSAGSGYTTPPTIQIAAPTAISLTGQTNNILALLAVANTNAGNYYVVVTNNFGSVTSSFASLIVAPAGYNQISGQHLSSGKLSLSFVGLQGTNYALDRSFNLSPANWIPQVTNPADANGNLIFTNTPDPTTNNFWRIRSVP